MRCQQMGAGSSEPKCAILTGLPKTLIMNATLTRQASMLASKTPSPRICTCTSHLAHHLHFTFTHGIATSRSHVGSCLRSTTTNAVRPLDPWTV